DRTLYPGLQRHALCHGARIQHGRPLLRLSQGRLRRAVCRRRAYAQDDVHRSALSPGGPAGAFCRPAALPGPCAAARARLDMPPGRHSASLESAPSLPGTARAGGCMTAAITLDELNALPADQFVNLLGGIFEHSAWVAEQVAAQRPFQSIDSLHRAMVERIAAAGPKAQMALIRAHPELAGKAAIRGDFTPESTSEQQGAGLDRC